MTYIQIFTTLVALGFLFFGVFLFRSTKVWSIIAFVIGVWLMNQIIYGGISLSDDKQRAIRNLELEDISSITIIPSQRREVLTNDTLFLRSLTDWKKVQECLHKTKGTLKTNRGEEWGCVLKIKKTDQEEILAGISKNGDQTILEMYSEGEYGENYGSMINNELGVALEDIMKKIIYNEMIK